MIKELKHINILYLVKTMDVGGAERFTLNLSRYFKDKTYSVTVASSGGLYVDQLERTGIKHIKLLNQPVLKNVLPLFKELKGILKEGDYSIVHCQHRIFTFLLQLVMNRNFHLLYTSHNLFTDLFQRLIFPDFAVAVSKSIYKNLISSSLIDKNKIACINYGVSIPENYYPQSGIITFGFSGRLIKEKGIFELLESVKMLASENLTFRLIIKGRGELNEITAFIEKNKLSQVISIIPPSYDEAEIYKEINVLVLPTRLNEGLPISILEAAARRILIVSADAGGVKDFLVDQRTGLMLGSTDPSSIAQVLKEIILGYDKFVPLINNALIKVKNEFSLDVTNRNYEDLYKKLLETTPS